MYFSTALALASTASIAAAHPFRHVRRDVLSFPAGTTFDILLNKGEMQLDSLSATETGTFSVIDIDLFDNTKDTITALKNQGKTVICYFSAGSREDWRDDKDLFQASDYGAPLDGWEGENWVNVKSDNVKSIMKARIELAQTKGCDAVDPDNMDGFSENQDGWGYDQSAYVDYVKYLAGQAVINKLAIGLKNSLDLIPSVIDVVQFAVNEQCHQYGDGEFGECDAYAPFATADKAVFNIEYGSGICDQSSKTKMTIINKPEDQGLNTLGGLCANNPAPDSQIVAAPVSAAASSAVTASATASVSVAKSTASVSVAKSTASASVTKPVSPTSAKASATPTSSASSSHHRGHHTRSAN